MVGSLHRNFFSCQSTALKTGGIKLPGNGIPFFRDTVTGTVTAPRINGLQSKNPGLFSQVRV